MKKKINKWLDKEITNSECIARVLFVTLIVLGIECLILHPFKKYSYITFNNEWGESKRCYKYEDKLVCEVKMDVKQYYK